MFAKIIGNSSLLTTEEKLKEKRKTKRSQIRNTRMYIEAMGVISFA